MSTNELLKDSIILASEISQNPYLELVSKSIQCITLVAKLGETVSDKLLYRKLEKFVPMANSCQTSGSFNKFLRKISENYEYKIRISEHMLLKINKFDTDDKLKIFSNACANLFYSNITEEELYEISQVIDFITPYDLKILNYLSENQEFIKIKDININNMSIERIYSYILKLKSLFLISEDVSVRWDSLKDTTNKTVKLSEFGTLFIKYI